MSLPPLALDGPIEWADVNLPTPHHPEEDQTLTKFFPKLPHQVIYYDTRRNSDTPTLFFQHISMGGFFWGSAYVCARPRVRIEWKHILIAHRASACSVVLTAAGQVKAG